MKYFTTDLINQVDEDSSEEVDKIWKKNVILYDEQLKRIRHRLSKKFLEIYFKEGKFHDAKLDYFKYYFERLSKRCRNNIEIYIKTYNAKYKIEYKDVINFNFNKFNVYCNNKNSEWLYDEIDYDIDKNILIHEIVLTEESSIKIEFEKLVIKKMN